MISIAIQHHPSRGLPAALRRYEVVRDPDPNGKPSAIRTYVECLRRTPPDAMWRVVLQDDVVLCARFDERLRIALDARIGSLIALFVPGRAPHGRLVREAHAEGRQWAQLAPRANWAPAVACAWPVDLAADFIDFAEAWIAAKAARGQTAFGDDPVIGAWMRDRRLPVWATVPCLVEHPDVGWSIVKQREYKGQNRARRAAVFVD